MLSPAAVLDAVTREWNRYDAILRGLARSEWDRPTRLPGWSVRDLVAHTIWGTSMEADALLRWRTGEAGPAGGRLADCSIEPNLLLAEQTASVAHLIAQLSLIDEGDADRPVPMPYGDVPLDVVLQVFAMEAGVHGHDLAATFGRERALEPDVVTATAVVLAAFLPVFGAAAREGPPDGTVVALRSPSIDLRLRYRESGWLIDREADPADIVSADDSTLTLFALGRVDVDAVTGPATARGRFKTWFPGP